MNRPIKFRVWDNRWGNWVGEFEAKFLNNPEYTCQQFTGLLDKNGKEIYEGDIVFYKASSWTMYTPQNARIFWSEEDACFFIQSASKSFLWQINANFAKKNLEIVGNTLETTLN